MKEGLDVEETWEEAGRVISSSSPSLSRISKALDNHDQTPSPSLIPSLYTPCAPFGKKLEQEQSSLFPRDAEVRRHRLPGYSEAGGIYSLVRVGRGLPPPLSYSPESSLLAGTVTGFEERSCGEGGGCRPREAGHGAASVNTAVVGVAGRAGAVRLAVAALLRSGFGKTGRQQPWGA